MKISQDQYLDDSLLVSDWNISISLACNPTQLPAAYSTILPSPWLNINFTSGSISDNESCLLKKKQIFFDDKKTV